MTSVLLPRPHPRAAHPAPATTLNLPAARPAWLEITETLAVFAFACIFYVSFYGELPYHDVGRFVAQIESGRYVWDMGHVWLQPVTLLWHQYLGFGESAELSQKQINTVFAAAAVAIFYYSLLRFKIAPGRRLAATLLVAASSNVLTLAPTAHMKLLAFPFLTAAFFVAARWEQRQISQHLPLVWAGLLLAMATAFHSSCLAAAPFVAIAILVVCRRNGAGWYAALARAALFSAVCGGLVLLEFEIARLVFFHGFLGLHTFDSTVEAKDALHNGFVSIANTVERLVFSTGNDFVSAPDLGSTLWAWASGYIPSLAPYAGRLLVQGLPWLATLVLVAFLYVRAATLAVRGAPVLLPLAFVVGSYAWNTYFNINEPEHWFHITVPTVFLLLTTIPDGWVRFLVPCWTATVVATSVTFWALPEARYPLDRYDVVLRHDFSKRDLLVGFLTYGGGANLSFFNLGPISTLMVDDLYFNSANAKDFFARLDRRLAEAQARGGRIVALKMFDPRNWNAPWELLSLKGMTKPQLFEHFHEFYTIVPLGQIAGMDAWQIEPSRSADYARPQGCGTKRGLWQAAVAPNPGCGARAEALAGERGVRDIPAFSLHAAARASDCCVKHDERSARFP